MKETGDGGEHLAEIVLVLGTKGRQMQENKYDNWINQRELPSEVSLLELLVVARRLGIDVDAIEDKHMAAECEELDEACRQGFEKLKMEVPK